MDITEVLNVGPSTTVIGLLIVFSVLILLSIIVTLLKYINSNPKKETLQMPSQPVTPVVTPAVTETVAETVIQDDTELIAVITAAIASSLNTTSDRLIVRSFRKISQWNDVVKHEQQNNSPK